MNNEFVKKYMLKPLLFGAFGFSMTLSTCVSAAALSLSDAPLQSVGKAEPNLIILLDSSGSMNTVLENDETRLDAAKDAAVNVVNGINNMRVGLATFNRTDLNPPDGVTDSTDDDDAYILKGLTSLSVSGTRQDLVTKIGAISAGGYSPLAESLASLGRYYVQGYESQQITLHPEEANETQATASAVFTRQPQYGPDASAPTSQNPAVKYYCQKNFVMVLTDGLPTMDVDIDDNTYLKDYDGDCGVDAGCDVHDKKTGTTYGSPDGSDYLDDVAKALKEIDLRPDLDKPDDTEHKNNITSYFIGFADENLRDNPLLVDAGANGGGGYTYAADAGALATAFSTSIDSVSSAIGTSASVAFNSTSLDIGSVIYSARFDTSDFSGRLYARSLNPATGRVAGTLWEASEKLADETSNSRQIITYLNGDGVAFTASTSSGVQGAGNTVTAHQADLKVNTNDSSTDDLAGLWDDRLAYIRGDSSKDSLDNFRTRGTFSTSNGNEFGRPKLLGDIVHSTPIYVGKPQLKWPASFGITQEPYAQFMIDQASRTPMVYVGANDGMLHGFNASTGEEVFGYIPSLVLSTATAKGLHAFTSSEYSHKYYVDLTPTVSDVYIDAGKGNQRDWNTVLIGGLRGGGKGYFALDVTDPSALTETNAADVVLWEFDGGNDTDRAHLGYSYSEAQVAKLNNGKWAVIFGNGYNSDNGVAGLFVVYIEDGLDGTWGIGDWKFISTSQGGAANRKNGLSSPRLIDLDGDSIVDRVYAGDLMGNMWAFDLSNASDANWGVVGSKPLFKVPNANTGSITEAIMGAPLVARNTAVSNGAAPNLLVMFGTGQYLNQGDLTEDNAGAFYAVWDNGHTVSNSSLTTSDLASRTLTSDSTGRKISADTDDDINWATQYGWKIPLSAGSGDYAGERVITAATLRRDTIFFSTIIPNPEPCASSGTGYLMSFDFRTGMAGTDAVADFDNDGDIDEQDAGYIGKQFGSSGGSGDSSSDPGMPGQSGFIGDVRCTPGSNGDVICDDIDVGDEKREGRLSWEELTLD